ncbi:two-component system response regulator [Saccharobesus litoralis]|uniref:Two-component system response regulator n=1 Tax=Saccharobesus litoralis TaxID=2172099 RepID=A0A2S0VXA0_9ALTE|nr:response regulator [Saccharobesus litoralis]AWB68856.1 two-component system response regulator [Saccharobesus litoralis]
MTEKKLLLLEDDEVYANVLSRQLTRKGYQVTHLATATDLVATCELLKPNILLLDMNLGQSSSLPYIAEVRRLLPKAKIIIVTGFASISSTVTAIKAGADNYLPKPIDLALLLNEIESVKVVEQSNDTLAYSEQRLSPERLEWEYIQKVLAENDGNISITARQLNMHRRTLQRKLSKKPNPV